MGSESKPHIRFWTDTGQDPDNPMELADDGDWVRREEVQHLVEQLEAAQALLADTYGALAHQMDGELLAQYDDVFPLRERLKAIGLIVEGEPNLPDPQVLIDPGPVPNPATVPPDLDEVMEQYQRDHQEGGD